MGIPVSGQLVLRFLISIAVLNVQGSYGGTTWVVGDEKGWQLNVDYSAWVQNKTFMVGDVLRFNYNKSTENVMEVSGQDYARCTTADPIQTYDDGNSSVPLSNATAGAVYYFISGVPGHCLDGMTLKIPMGVQLASPSPSPSPFPSQSPVPAPASSASSNSSITDNSPPPISTISSDSGSVNPSSPSPVPSSSPVSLVSAITPLLFVFSSLLFHLLHPHLSL